MRRFPSFLRITNDPILAMNGTRPRVDYRPRPRTNFEPVGDARLDRLSRLRRAIPVQLNEGMGDGEPGFWNPIASSLSSAISGAIPAIASVQVAKIQAGQTASLLREQSKLYTPQNFATLQAQGSFEAQARANAAAAAAGTTSAPMTTGTLLALGGLALGAVFLLTRRK